jgi:hypothetical protein
MITEPLSKADAGRFESVLEAKQENRLELRARPNVIGLDIGYRVKGGKQTTEKAVKVYVSHKLRKTLISDSDLVPKSISVGRTTIPTDVEVGRVDVPHIFDRRFRPLVGGASVSPGARGTLTGTIGVCVTKNDGNVHILSNNHVLADANRLAIGSSIIQPGAVDGGDSTSDRVAVLESYVPLEFGTTTVSIFGTSITLPNVNHVDAALARVIDIEDSEVAFNGADRRIHWVGYPRHRNDDPMGFFERLFLLGRQVCKMGRTTEFTLGRIVSVSYDTWIGPYASGQNAWFDDQIRIQGENGVFSRPGDSGSLVMLVEDRSPVGLLFSGGGDFTNANPIDDVMAELGIPQI